MSSGDSALGHHPAPARHRAGLVSMGFGLIGGPLAWFAQLCAGYALSSAPCFSDSTRTVLPPAGVAGSWPPLIALMIAAIIVALAALAVSWRAFVRTREESGGSQAHLLEVGAGRTRFMALWGVLLSGTFAVATAMTAVALSLLPRCAG